VSGGLKAFGEVFPGFEHDLGHAGAILERLTQDVRYERADVGLWPMRDLLSILFASRPVIEFTLRRRVTECVSRRCLTGAAFVTSAPALFPQPLVMIRLLHRSIPFVTGLRRDLASRLNEKAPQ
jgi:hypothetical protein